jgi:hypothetical protein
MESPPTIPICEIINGRVTQPAPVYFRTTCLLRLPEGGTYFDNFGGAYINDLGYKFYELIASKILEM